MKTRSRIRLSAALAAGMLLVAAQLEIARAGVIVLTGSAITPLAAMAAAAVRWLPDFHPDPLSLTPLLPNSDVAMRLAGGESEETRVFPGQIEDSIAHLENVALLRAGTGSHYSYRTPTTLHAGYGCLFDSESWKLSKSSKQGLEEPSHFYFKLTFRF